MSEKKIWRIDECRETWYQSGDGSYCDTVRSDVFMDAVFATEEEIKELIDGDWNPICMTDEYDEHFRRYIYEECTPATIDDLKKKINEANEYDENFTKLV